MNTDIFANADWLNVDNNHGYGALPIPQARDAEISGLLRAWMMLADSDRKAVAGGVLEEQRFTLLAYSERMASFAVRDRTS